MKQSAEPVRLPIEVPSITCYANTIAAPAAWLTLPGWQSQSAESKASLGNRWPPGAIEWAGARGGTNGAAIAEVAQALPAAQREVLEFLLENMPEHDLRELPPSLLIENVALAYEAFAKAPWRGQVPKEIFLNDILPKDESADLNDFLAFEVARGPAYEIQAEQGERKIRQEFRASKPPG